VAICDLFPPVGQLRTKQAEFSGRRKNSSISEAIATIVRCITCNTYQIAYNTSYVPYTILCTTIIHFGAQFVVSAL